MGEELLRDAVLVMLRRDLRGLDHEIAAYPDDESLWLTAPGISNSAGNLVLHLAGNLRHFVGHIVGGSGYARNREAEFSTRGVSREALRAEIRTAASEVETALRAMDLSRLADPFPIGIGQPPKTVRMSDWLVHLATHLTYHIGQIDYHRRLLTEGATVVDALSLNDIPEVAS
jgi:uncharacterized damage-inducible protein DinB